MTKPVLNSLLHIHNNAFNIQERTIPESEHNGTVAAGCGLGIIFGGLFFSFLTYILCH